MGALGETELRLALQRARRAVAMVAGGEVAADEVARVLDEAGADLDVVQARLDEQQEHRRIVAEASPQLQWVSDGRGNLLELSRNRWGTITGQAAEDALGMGWQAVIHPDDLPRFREAVARGAETRAPYDIVVRVRTADGGYRWFRSRSFPKCDARGEIVRTYGFTEDIHDQVQASEALQKSEARLRAIVDTTPECVMTIGADGRLRHINAAGTKLFGAASPEALLGVEAMSLVAPEHRFRWRINHDRVRQGQATRWRFDILDAGGARLQLEIHSVPFPMPDGSTATLGIARDITHRRENEERLRMLQVDFAHVARVNEMGQLAAAIAHELNQPLQAISNYVSAAAAVAAKHGVDAGLAAPLGAASEQTQRAGEIIRALRNLTRHGMGERAQTTIDQVIGEAMTLVLIGVKNDDISIVMEGDRNVVVNVDRAQIQQLMYNLGRNAIEAMADSPDKQLIISTRARDDGFVEVRFTDSGCGLSPEVERRLFTAFLTTKTGGMGVGLSICRRIVEAHGGRIWAEDLRDGAAFAFTLPIVRGAAAP